MPVKIKQNININVNTSSKKDKTKTKKATRRKKKNKNQLVSYNPSNNAYNPNARTMQTSMSSSGGGGSIILNKPDYSKVPYGLQMNDNMNNEMNKKIEDINKRFTDGFNTYHNNTLLPVLNNYHDTLIKPGFQNVDNKVNKLEVDFNNYHNNTLLPALNNYHDTLIKPGFQKVNNKFNKLEVDFNNYHNNYVHPSFNETKENHDTLKLKLNENQLNSQAHKDGMSPSYHAFRSDFDDLNSVNSSNLLSTKDDLVYSDDDESFNLFQHFKNSNENNQEISQQPEFDFSRGPEYRRNQDIINEINVKKERIKELKAKRKQGEEDIFNLYQDSLTIPFDEADGYKLKPDFPEETQPHAIIEEIELPMNLSAMNMSQLKYIINKLNLSIDNNANSIDEYRDEIVDIMKEREPNNDSKLIFNIPTNLMTDEQIQTGEELKAKLDYSNDEAKHPSEDKYIDKNISQMNKSELMQVYTQLNLESAYDKKMKKNELYNYLKNMLPKDHRKFKVKL